MFGERTNDVEYLHLLLRKAVNQVEIIEVKWWLWPQKFDIEENW